MNNLKHESLEITLEEGPRNIISWDGRSESRDPSLVLMPYFKQILDKLKGKELVIRFENLKYMNSSTVPPIIYLIKNLEENGISSTITFDKNSRWQYASFKALETIAKEMIYIRIQGI